MAAALTWCTVNSNLTVHWMGQERKIKDGFAMTFFVTSGFWYPEPTRTRCLRVSPALFSLCSATCKSLKNEGTPLRSQRQNDFIIVIARHEVPKQSHLRNVFQGALLSKNNSAYKESQVVFRPDGKIRRIILDKSV
jgi:hypothetical protein